MHIIARNAVMGLLISAGNAMGYSVVLKAGPSGGTLTAEGTSSTITLPLAGGTLDISVALDTTTPEHLQGVQMQFTTNASSNYPILVPSTGLGQGVINHTGTGARFNDPEWIADSACSVPVTPNPPATGSGPLPLTSSPSNFYDCGYSSSDWSSLYTLMGWLRLTVPAINAPGRLFTVNAVGVTGTDLFFGDVAGAGGSITINQIPEPASAILLLAALPLLRKRR